MILGIFIFSTCFSDEFPTSWDCAKDDADEVRDPRQDREARGSILGSEYPQSHGVAAWTTEPHWGPQSLVKYGELEANPMEKRSS